MYINNRISPIYKVLISALLLVFFINTIGTNKLTIATARGQTNSTNSLTLSSTQIISDGQFVYGPNIGAFNLQNYLQDNPPHLLIHTNQLIGRAQYFSINPKIILTFLEISGHLISNPSAEGLSDPFGIRDSDFVSQIDYISNQMIDAYYLQLNSYSVLPISQRNLPPFVTPAGLTIIAAPDTNAGTYALIAGLAAIGQPDLLSVLDNNQSMGFYQTYRRLFGNDDPLDNSNHIFLPQEIDATAAPDHLLQLPFLQGLSWRFGGVHNTGGGTTFTDASSLDFYPWPVAWGDDTSKMWVVASAGGTPVRLSNCGYKILHSNGWETFYYHLENTQFLSGSINQNDKIGVIANTLAEATCDGGAASGPHVHFSLRHNGAFVAINGTTLSEWYVHSGRYSYDTDPNYMWVERQGVKKYAYQDTLLSQGTANFPKVLSSLRADPNPSTAAILHFQVTFSTTVTGVNKEDFALITTSLANAAITQVSGSGAQYTLTVSTGTGIGTLRLDVVDNDTILDASGNPLGGTGSGNGNFTTGQKYTLDRDNKFISSGTLDGWLRETSENSGVGGIFNTTSTLAVGDDSGNRQLCSLLSFDTSRLPDNAKITKVIIKIKKAGINGTNPINTHGFLTADMKKGFFGSSNNLQAADFQSLTLQKAVGNFAAIASTPEWFQMNLKPAYFPAIHLSGSTQFRLRFALDDNNDNSADFIKFFSGDGSITANQPVLIVEYTLP